MRVGVSTAVNAGYMRQQLIRILSIAALFIVSFQAWPQTWDEIRDSRGLYLYGEGFGSSAIEADRNAMEDLASQIKVRVSSELTLKSDKAQTGNGRRTKFCQTDSLESIITSYSDVTLYNCRRLIVDNGPKEYHYVRYIPMSDIFRMFTEREAKIKYMLNVAEKAERELKMDAALKNYYWSCILLRTLPSPSSVSYTDLDGESHLAEVWVSGKISEILDGLTFEFDGYADMANGLGRLYISYEGEPVTSVDYTYMDGINWSILTSAKNGLGVLEFRKNLELSSISAMVEYQYYHERHQDPEIAGILEVMAPVNFPEAYKSGIRLDVRKRDAVAQKRQTEQQYDMATISQENTAMYSAVVRRILDVVSDGGAEDVRELFTSEGYDAYKRLLMYGNAKILDDSKLSYLKFDDEVYCRSVPMDFAFQTNDKHFVEDVVFVFDSTARVTGITFALEDRTVQDILSKSKWDDRHKMVLIQFLESYKTAFALKDIDYLSSIFSEDALIITGRVVKKVAVENQIVLQSQYVEYNRQSKEEYMNNLRRSFASKEYINLKFSNADIGSYRADSGLFGIQLKQDYYSSNYGDTGYLYLYVDLRDSDRPIIHIRTWQPEPNPDVDSVTGLFGPWNF